MQQRDQKREVRRNISVLIVLILLFLCGTTTFFSARYAGTAGGISQTTIARFDVSSQSTANTSLVLEMGEGDQEAVFSFDIVGNSDVSFTYSITVTLPQHDVEDLVIRIGDQALTVSPDKTEYLFKNVGTVSYGEQTEGCDIVFDASNVTQDISLTGITVSILAEQVD